ncbi:collagen alpha-2(I) chain-like [Dasypus novemcinctus]|uniref:collagen alpha-2(I) chain-like n=1 Tax=Dasypus novemcinctus TaxID=9361 RepID=UPI00265F7953|nr:collagen alpha-2(I) chain-like [Dasypus novemcinctus]
MGLSPPSGQPACGGLSSPPWHESCAGPCPARPVGRRRTRPSTAQMGRPAPPLLPLPFVLPALLFPSPSGPCVRCPTSSTGGTGRVARRDTRHGPGQAPAVSGPLWVPSCDERGVSPQCCPSSRALAPGEPASSRSVSKASPGPAARPDRGLRRAGLARGRHPGRRWLPESPALPVPEGTAVAAREPGAAGARGDGGGCLRAWGSGHGSSCPQPDKGPPVSSSRRDSRGPSKPCSLPPPPRGLRSPEDPYLQVLLAGPGCQPRAPSSPMALSQPRDPQGRPGLGLQGK